MSRVCELTGKRVAVVNNVSHSHIRTKSRRLPNLQKKSYFVAEVGRKVTARLSAKAIKIIDRQGGLASALRKAKEDNLSLNLRRVRNRL